MSLLRLLQLLTVLLVVLSASMLGLGQEESWFSVTVAVVAFAAFMLNDCLRWFYLHRLVANAAMLVVAVLSLNDFFSLSSREQLIAIGELLIYVQMILLVQKKNERIYGQVAVFSLLAVVVAALLTHSLVFGLMLITYTITGTYALSLFALYRSTEGIGLQLPRRRKRKGALAQIEFQPLVAPPTVAASLVRLGVLRELAAISVATIMFGATFFYTLPRIGGAGWEEGGSASSHRVGFAPEITFDQMGKLLQNNDLVMRVTFRDMRSDDPYTVITTPYFRGGVLTRYVLERGQPRWKKDVIYNYSDTMRLTRPKPSSELVGVDVLLEPTRDSRLFFIYPPYATRRTPSDVRFQPSLRTLFRDEDEREQHALSRSYRYETATTAFRFGLQTPVTPHINPAQTREQRRSLEAEKFRLLRVEPEDYDRLGLDRTSVDHFPGLRKLAEEVIAERVPDRNDYEKAVALQNWFLDPGRFHYTINFDEIRARRKIDLDPVEDFVVHHRRGHCQYFASALALMLRSVGIPSRVVIGYRGGEFNYLGQYYVVRQSDAHAWVEAYIAAEDIPENAMDRVERHAGGGWLRLDPTPAGDNESGANRNVLDRMNDSLDYAQWLWSDYVLQLTPDQQRAAGLSRMQSSNAWDWTQLLNPQKWQPRRRARRRGQGRANTAGWAWWQIALIAGAGLTTALLMRYRLRFRRRRRVRRKAPLPSITYYRELERFLKRFGWQRPPGMTPREFAATSSAELAATLGDESVGRLPNLVVEAYYQDRFRPEGAPPPTIEAASQALTALEDAYQQWRRTRRSRS